MRLKAETSPFQYKYKYGSDLFDNEMGSMRGVKRIFIFCLMITVLPTILIIIPLYLRHNIFVDKLYQVSESDVLQVTDGISTIFCESQTIKMNSSFSAFQLKQTPTVSSKRKHIRLKKSMTLPDDTLEYWGFYLLKGATVILKVCSRYEGARILVVRGERNLRTCGLMQHNQNKFGAKMDDDHNQVKVTFEHAQEITDNNIEMPNEDDKGKDFGNDKIDVSTLNRLKREGIGTRYMFDGRIAHGGNAINYTETKSEENSVSSFETGLLTCYDGQILLTRGFDPNRLCTDIKYLESNDSLKTIHNIVSNGYYYYIFFSDNDLVSNDINAIFDIHKPTIQYSNSSKVKECLNKTECTFPISFLSDETVIVEVPTQDGIESHENDTLSLISTCHPRMYIYMIFPVTVMFLILGCAFL